MIHWRLDTLRYIRKRLPPHGIIEEVVPSVQSVQGHGPHVIIRWLSHGHSRPHGHGPPFCNRP
jgi:hypothetical protein